MCLYNRLLTVSSSNARAVGEFDLVLINNSIPFLTEQEGVF